MEASSRRTVEAAEALTPGRMLLFVRAALGGALMGLANLVPGISGGTMLLATGIYPRFVTAVAELTMLRVRAPSLLLLAVVAAAAAGVILFLAGPTRRLVIEQRWVMYSLFIGLTLGGVPIVWRLAQRASSALILGTVAGFCTMVTLGLVGAAAGGAGGSSFPGLVLAGAAGAAAMVLPGVSGGYLLLVLGQYLPVLDGVDALKRGVVLPLAAGAAPDPVLFREALGVVIPVGLGVAIGVIVVSNLVRWTLMRFPSATLGVLLGLLLGAVVQLWPFQEPAAQAVDPRASRVAHERLEPYLPDPARGAAALGLIALGFATTVAIGRLGAGQELPARAREATPESG